MLTLASLQKRKKKLFSWAYLQKTHCWIKFWKSTFNLALLTFLMSVVDALHSSLLLRKLNSLVCYSRSVLLICRATEGCNRAHRVNCSVLLILAREFSRYFAVSLNLCYFGHSWIYIFFGILTGIWGVLRVDFPIFNDFNLQFVNLNLYYWFTREFSRFFCN